MVPVRGWIVSIENFILRMVGHAPRDSGLCLAKETLPTCDGRDLDSSRSGPTRNRGRHHPPNTSEKRLTSTLLSLSLLATCLKIPHLPF
jgi:hypothetical protein